MIDDKERELRAEARELMHELMHSLAAAMAGIDPDEPRTKAIAEHLAKFFGLALVEGYRRGLAAAAERS